MQSSVTINTMTVSQDADNVRLDKVLAEIFPDTGLRLRRRLCDEGRVTVDGRKRRPGYKVQAGQVVQFEKGDAGVSHEELGIKVVKRQGQFAAVYKPGGVHSAAIAGKVEPSIEGELAGVFPDDEPVLLNRLDYLTSGLLMVALNQEAQDEYTAYEEAGKIKKFYIARVEGRLDGMVTVKSKLDTDNRKTTKVLDVDDDDPRRWTDVKALSHDHGDDTTKVRCLIMKGARHQIRAHLASLGHPIVGDPLYGSGGDSLALLHKQIEFPGFEAEVAEAGCVE